MPSEIPAESPDISRRRHRHRMPPGDLTAPGLTPALGMGIMWAVCLFAVLSPGAPFQASHGIVFGAAGVTMLALPPRERLPWWCCTVAAVLVLLASLCFLPAAWFSFPAWRAGLQEAGLNTGSAVTAHPLQSREYLAALAATAAGGLYLLSHRVSTRVTGILALLFASGVAASVILAILAKEQVWKPAWDPEPDFGFFPNRNHTATLLVMGFITGVGGTFHAVKSGRGGMAGLWALTVVSCLAGLVGYNLSRAGILLTGACLVIWLSFLGRKSISPRVLLIVGAFGIIVSGLVWMADTGIRERLTGRESDSRNLVNGGEVADFRILVYRDTMAMIGHEPWVGVGPGMFRYVFPQYRHDSSTSNNSQILHPESDWLMVAAESGVPAALVLATGTALLLAAAIRGSRQRSAWPLRLACLIAAAVIPVHGLFDVPGHRIGLIWSAFLLIGLAGPDFGTRGPLSPRLRALWRVAGALMAAAGFSLIHAEWFGGTATAITRPGQLADEARGLLKQDQEEQAKAAAQPAVPEEAPGASPADGEDRLETAIHRVSDAIRFAPLDPELHYLKGALGLYFSDKEAEVDQSFLIQRKLDPTWVELPLRQSAGWSGIDPVRTANLWQEAMIRAERLEAVASNAPWNRARVFEEIMNQAAKDAKLSTLAIKIQGFAAERDAVAWAERAHRDSLSAGITDLLGTDLPGSLREQLLVIWEKRDKDAAKAWQETHP